jgi:hypothetical protein
MKEAFGYDADFYAWTQEQAERLRQSRPNNVDWEHVAEEIEDLGRSEKRELVSRLVILMSHLLKWQNQPAHRGKSWRLSIKEHRLRLARHLSENPSLKAKLNAAIADAYEEAVIVAARQTELDEDVFSEICPWSFDQMMDASFLPEDLDPQ